jgi:RNA polymerase sigma factor (sigma-70 family)
MQEKFLSNYKLIYQAIYSLLGGHENAEIYARKHGMEFSDLEQIAAEALWKACLSYEEQGTATFAYYAITCIKKRILLEARRRGPLIRVPELRAGRPKPYEMECLDEPIFETGQKRMLYEVIPSNVSVEQAVIRKITLEEKLRWLKQEEKTVVCMKLDGYTEKEIADMIGKTTGAVQMILQRALNRLSPRREKRKNLMGEFAALYEAGVSREEIMKRLNINDVAYRNYKYRYHKQQREAG